MANEWDDAERKECRERWEQAVCSEIDEQVDDRCVPNKKDAEYEAGLKMVRSLTRTQQELREAVELLRQVEDYTEIGEPGERFKATVKAFLRRQQQRSQQS